MTTENQSDLGTESNNPTQNDSLSTRFDNTRLADIVSKSFLSGEEVKEAPASEEKNAEAEVQATSEQEEGEVHSQLSETEAEQEKHTDSEETEETKSDEELDRGLPKGVKKRIDKLAAKRREAEAEVERLKNELDRLSQEATKPAQTPTKDNPYANLNTVEEVSREIEQAKAIRRWCEMNPDGATVTGKDGREVDYSAEEIRNIKIKALDAIEEHLPARARYLQNYQQIEQVAVKEYPWWKDRSSSERQIAESFIKHFPEIQRFPDYKMVLGDYIRGVKARESTAKRVNTIAQKPPVQPKITSTPQRVPEKEAAFNESKKRFTSTGNRDDLASIIAKGFL